MCVCVSRSVVSDSLQPHGWYPARLLCPWDFPGKNTGVCCHFLLCRMTCGSSEKMGTLDKSLILADTASSSLLPQRISMGSVSGKEVSYG